MSDSVDDLELSRKHEMEVYIKSMRAMYDNAVAQNEEVYDIAASLTDDFRSITADAIMADSRIIKTLRFAVAPSISQMKLGQLVGENSTKAFEQDKLAVQSRQGRKLSRIADSLAQFACRHLDRSRFRWISKADPVSPLFAIESRYAKQWTCSIAADQNAQTRYRNWRKDQQEQAVVSQLIKLGYTRSSFSGVIVSETDVNLGEFTTELRVQGRTRQKADLVVRSKKSHRLVLIEAKAVGVELDASKRIKECCDKANDWKSSSRLGRPLIVAVIAGFFNESTISSLRKSEICVVWEHGLAKLEDLL